LAGGEPGNHGRLKHCGGLIEGFDQPAAALKSRLI